MENENPLLGAVADEAPFFTDTYVSADHISLAAIREAAGMSPAELGQSWGYRGGREVASTVRQMERRPDFLVSRLAAYINAAGGTADLIVNVNGKTIKFRVVE